MRVAQLGTRPTGIFIPTCGDRGLLHRVELAVFVVDAEVLPALQGDGHVAVEPDEVVEFLNAELRALPDPRVLHHLNNLELSRLVGNLLPGRLAHLRNLSAGVVRCHRHVLMHECDGLLGSECAGGNLDIDNDANGAQTRLFVDDFAGVRAVVVETGLQHHFFGIEADALVGARVIVVAADRIGVAPRSAELSVVADGALMDDGDARVFCVSRPEVACLG